MTSHVGSKAFTQNKQSLCKSRYTHIVHLWNLWSWVCDLKKLKWGGKELRNWKFSWHICIQHTAYTRMHASLNLLLRLNICMIVNVRRFRESKQKRYNLKTIFVLFPYGYAHVVTTTSPLTTYLTHKRLSISTKS